MSIRQKVYAYITHQGRLLIFSHTQFPEAGIQVPGGTVEPDEALETAVLREAVEETGLKHLELVSYLGMNEWAVPERNEYQHRHFYHLRCAETPPETWRHHEINASDGSPAIEFEFFWVKFPYEVPELAGEQGRLLARLVIGD